MSIPGVQLAWEGGTVSGEWHRASDAHSLLVLGHGAGFDLRDALLRSIGDALTPRGISVLRFNFPYKEAGRKAPGPQKVSEDCFRAVAEQARSRGPRLFLGGKSYGGRMASHVVADGVDADGLVFLGYPLHPPGKPERLRDEHLRGIEVPMLFCQGTRDPFATPDLLHRTVASLKRAKLVEIDGGDHSFRVRGRSPDDVRSQLADAVHDFIANA